MSKRRPDPNPKGDPNIKPGPGRPKGSVNGIIKGSVTRCRDFMERKGWARLEEIVDQGSDRNAIQAAEILAAYGYGKPQAKLDLTSAGEQMTIGEWFMAEWKGDQPGKIPSESSQ